MFGPSASSFSHLVILVCIYLSIDELSAMSHCFLFHCDYDTNKFRGMRWTGCGFVAHIADISPYDTCPAVHLSEIQQ